MYFRKLTTSVFLAMTVLALPVTASAGYEGAIAFSQSTGSHGWAKNYNSKRAASNAALNNCPAHDCKVIYNFTNSCAALAADPEGAYGSDWDVKKKRAERKALNACADYSDECRIVVSVCSQNR